MMKTAGVRWRTLVALFNGGWSVLVFNGKGWCVLIFQWRTLVSIGV